MCWRCVNEYSIKNSKIRGIRGKRHYPAIRALLIAYGHSGSKAFDIIIDGKREMCAANKSCPNPDRRSINWIKAIYHTRHMKTVGDTNGKPRR